MFWGKLAGKILVLAKGGFTDTEKYDFPRNVEIYFQIALSAQKAKLHILWGFRPMFSACGEMHKIVLSWPWFQFHLGSYYDLKYFIDKLLFALKTHG